MFCPVNHALMNLNGKWKLQVIYVISEAGTIRFNELSRRLQDISNQMLAKTLQELVDSGIVYRHQYNEIPPKVEYCLTEVGQKIQPVFDSLSDFGNALYEAQNQEHVSE